VSAGRSGSGAPGTQPLLGFPPSAPSWADLIEGPPNAAALAMARRPEAWAGTAAIIRGPAASGLSFIAEAWTGEFGGRFFKSAALARVKPREIEALAAQPVALDDADLMGRAAEDPVLSLLNSAATAGGRVLLTAHRPVADWNIASPDLLSRLSSLPVAEIAPPDEAMLRARIAAAATRHFMKLSPEALNFLVPRADLSYEFAENLVERVSAAVSEEERAPSVALLRAILDGMTCNGETGADG
jgi:chromosomal replication initiation ATPase DnaA